MAYGIMAVLLTRRFPDIFLFPQSTSVAVGVAGTLLLWVGLAVYVVTLAWFLAAHRNGALVTNGPFRVVRHPLYATWLWLVFPGIALLCRSWLVLGVVPVGFATFRAFIQHEEDELERRFGCAYEAYRLSVNQITPRILALTSRRRTREP
ncbi:MAG: isoprenylcysteine carboxylmethyltransferase family protein [Verrucomicrobia bacterium]|jgi:protein-S-isoprenylcysteine O-methyltransferase Ste14|nr:isoprenylcysteine carboxylmethyltransferase family protein [Verrucomicrobiota bacterium]MBT7064734.1 isoprenylcysteine carboxylmethyltransferase family protein [Verrucomicrobiota bacterium]MBT7699186.1 isoprenylcysteine carboxylmethyltransferase family protein [Verrucomicrobiota bacterium]